MLHQWCSTADAAAEYASLRATQAERPKGKVRLEEELLATRLETHQGTTVIAMISW